MFYVDYTDTTVIYQLYTNMPEPASMFEANAKLPKTMGLVSTLLYFPRTNSIHLHCRYDKGKATA